MFFKNTSNIATYSYRYLALVGWDNSSLLQRNQSVQAQTPFLHSPRPLVSWAGTSFHGQPHTLQFLGHSYQCLHKNYLAAHRVYINKICVVVERMPFKIDFTLLSSNCMVTDALLTTIDQSPWSSHNSVPIKRPTFCAISV